MINNETKKIIKEDIKNIIKNGDIRYDKLAELETKEIIYSIINTDDIPTAELDLIYNEIIVELKPLVNDKISETENSEDDEQSDIYNDFELENDEYMGEPEKIDIGVLNRVNKINKNKNIDEYDKNKFNYNNQIGGLISKKENISINNEYKDLKQKEFLITKKIIEDPEKFSELTKSYGLNIDRGIGLVTSIINGFNTVNDSISVRSKRNMDNLYFVPILNKKTKTINYQPTVKFANLLLFFIDGIKVETGKIEDRIMVDGSIRIFVEVKVTDTIYHRELTQVASEPISVNIIDNNTGKVVSRTADYDKKVELAYSKAFRNAMVKLYGFWIDAIADILGKKK
jgi:hypothetical protein